VAGDLSLLVDGSDGIQNGGWVGTKVWYEHLTVMKGHETLQIIQSFTYV